MSSPTTKLTTKLSMSCSISKAEINGHIQHPQQLARNRGCCRQLLQSIRWMDGEGLTPFWARLESAVWHHSVAHFLHIQWLPSSLEERRPSPLVTTHLWHVTFCRGPYSGCCCSCWCHQDCRQATSTHTSTTVNCRHAVQSSRQRSNHSSSASPLRQIHLLPDVGKSPVAERWQDANGWANHYCLLILYVVITRSHGSVRVL